MIAARVVAGEDHLDGDPAIQADLPRLVDDPHPAAGDLSGEEIVAEGPRLDVGRSGRAGRGRPRIRTPPASLGFRGLGRGGRDRPIQPGRIQPREAFAVVAGLAVLAERPTVVEVQQDQLGQQGRSLEIRRAVQELLDPRPIAALPGGSNRVQMSSTCRAAAGAEARGFEGGLAGHGASSCSHRSRISRSFRLIVRAT